MYVKSTLACSSLSRTLHFQRLDVVELHTKAVTPNHVSCDENFDVLRLLVRSTSLFPVGPTPSSETRREQTVKFCIMLDIFKLRRRSEDWDFKPFLIHLCFAAEWLQCAIEIFLDVELPTGVADGRTPTCLDQHPSRLLTHSRLLLYLHLFPPSLLCSWQSKTQRVSSQQLPFMVREEDPACHGTSSLLLCYDPVSQSSELILQV